MRNFFSILLYFSTLMPGLSLGASEILFAKAVKQPMKQTLMRDLQRLEDMPFAEISAETLKVLGLTGSEASALPDWLNERVKVVVSVKPLPYLNLALNKSLTIEKSYIDYPYPNVVPYSLNRPKDPNEETDETSEENMVVMTNLGAALYFDGKNKKQLYNYNVATGFLRSTDILIDSPRSGIIQIGPGLFDRRFNINNNDLDSIANSINRLGTFFHEARHSDGHGESLGFAHAICPKGHDLEGANACDENLNGPYTISARVVTEMIKACDDQCTARELEILKLTVLDSHSRVLSKTHKGERAKFWPATPEILE